MCCVSTYFFFLFLIFFSNFLRKVGKQNAILLDFVVVLCPLSVESSNNKIIFFSFRLLSNNNYLSRLLFILSVCSAIRIIYANKVAPWRNLCALLLFVLFLFDFYIFILKFCSRRSHLRPKNILFLLFCYFKFSASNKN